MRNAPSTSSLRRTARSIQLQRRASRRIGKPSWLSTTSRQSIGFTSDDEPDRIYVRHGSATDEEDEGRRESRRLLDDGLQARARSAKKLEGLERLPIDHRRHWRSQLRRRRQKRSRLIRSPYTRLDHISRADDPRPKPFILEVPCRGPPSAPSVIAAPRDLEHPTQNPHWTKRLLHTDEGEPHRLSLAKKAVAFRRISFSIRSSEFSLRRRRSSARSSGLSPSAEPEASPRFTQLRTAVSVRSSSLATDPTVRPLSDQLYGLALELVRELPSMSLSHFALPSGGYSLREGVHYEGTGSGCRGLGLRRRRTWLWRRLDIDYALFSSGRCSGC